MLRALLGAALCATAALGTTPGAARAQHASSGAACAVTHQPPDSAGVQAVEDAWVAAGAAHDSTALACILADDFIDTDWQGARRTKAQMLRRLGHRPRMTQRITGWHIRLYGTTAVVRGTNIVTDSTGAELIRLRFTDVLVRRDGTWHAVAAQETPEQLRARATP
ncbi:MAG: nuclear transport factor 2 family protein [Gemmatimonadaceae bacterium]|nr:nuclear transport factor 2 family protein [Gemmatimonadaceae bacterium]